MSAPPKIRVGIGGWTFEPWRNNFYPAGLSHSRELEYASRRLSAIEVNGTYYSSQKPATFAKWRDETPEEVADTIGRALQYVPRERLIACTNCGLAPMSRAVAEAKLRALGEGAALARQRFAA